MTPIGLQIVHESLKEATLVLYAQKERPFPLFSNSQIPIPSSAQVAGTSLRRLQFPQGELILSSTPWSFAHTSSTAVNTVPCVFFCNCKKLLANRITHTHPKTYSSLVPTDIGSESFMLQLLRVARQPSRDRVALNFMALDSLVQNPPALALAPALPVCPTIPCR